MRKPIIDWTPHPAKGLKTDNLKIRRARAEFNRSRQAAKKADTPGQFGFYPLTEDGIFREVWLPAYLTGRSELVQRGKRDG